MGSKRQHDGESTTSSHKHRKTSSELETLATTTTTPPPPPPSTGAFPFLPSFGAFEPLHSSQVTDTLPPLPTPASRALEAQAFRHMSVTSGNDLASYEELEFFGDSVIHFLSTCLLHATFTTLKTGRRSQIRELMVRNRTLAKFFHAYDMDSRMEVSPEFWKANQASIDKVYGDMFEAYIGAVVLSHKDDMQVGLRIVGAWLRALWGQEIKKELVNHERSSTYYGHLIARPEAATESAAPGSDSPSAIISTVAGTTAAPEAATARKGTPKDQLGKLIGGPGVRLTYEDMPMSENKRKQQKSQLGHELFHVGVYLNGWGADHELLGIGAAPKKSEAGNKAAMQAMEAKKKMKLYSGRKEAFLKAREEAGGITAKERFEQRNNEETGEKGTDSGREDGEVRG